MRTVLVVDSSSVHVRQLCKVLHDHGYATLSREHLDDLAGYVVRHQPDLVVLDEFTPQLTGIDALRDLARDERTRDVPVIMVASHAQAAGKVRALWQGARDYLVKPVDRGRFLALVDALVDTPLQRTRELVG
jgi:twitching motility two-component system response regulator PilH